MTCGAGFDGTSSWSGTATKPGSARCRSGYRCGIGPQRGAARDGDAGGEREACGIQGRRAVGPGVAEAEGVAAQRRGLRRGRPSRSRSAGPLLCGVLSTGSMDSWVRPPAVASGRSRGHHSARLHRMACTAPHPGESIRGAELRDSHRGRRPRSVPLNGCVTPGRQGLRNRTGSNLTCLPFFSRVAKVAGTAPISSDSPRIWESRATRVMLRGPIPLDSSDFAILVFFHDGNIAETALRPSSSPQNTGNLGGQG